MKSIKELDEQYRRSGRPVIQHKGIVSGFLAAESIKARAEKKFPLLRLKR